MRKFWGLALALLLVCAPAAYAQTILGNIYGTATDESGAVLPGVSVTLEGETGTRSTVTGPQGSFRFINLNRGQYKVVASLTGFATVSRTVQVTTAENVEFTIAMKVSGVQETIEVVGETPLVDTKKRGTSVTMTTEELQQVPNARDPWGVLKNVAGVLLDRVNIAGNENGQQAAVAGKGTDSTDKTWNLDGIQITDMSATGASPTYFDFDAFQEISVSTGGSDIAQPGAGIGINMVTKRGTNKYHGSARFLISDKDMSFGNVPDAMANDPRLQGNDKADHINSIKDYGFDLGGPILKDKLWFYFTWGKQDIKLFRLTQTPDDTLLQGFNAKLNWQAGSNTMVSAFWFEGKKQKFGRSAGWPVNAADSFNWDQDNAYEDKVGGPNRPPGLWKLQIDHTFSPNFFMSVKGAYYNTGFTLTPRGGLDQSFTIDYVNGVATGSYIDYTAVRPQWHFNLDGNYFFEGLGGNNELKFGFAYRDMTTTSITHYGGNALVGIINSPTDQIAWIARDGVVKYGGKYTAAYIGDTLSLDRMTVNVGLRWDGQKAKNLASEAPANPSYPNTVPALTYGGSDTLIDWSSLTPRVGVSYALDEARKTVLRASYSSYADSLSFGNVTDENPAAYGFLAYGWNDINGDRVVQQGEVNLGDFQYNVNIDPDNPGAVGSTVSKINRDLKPRRDHEVVVGIDREVGANLAIGVAYTWRRGNDWEYSPRLAGACDNPSSACPIIQPGQYIQNAPSTANGFTAFTYSPPDDLVSAGSGGRLRTNAPGYHTTFNGLELTMVKRLSNKWMARMAFSWNSWTENWDGQTYSLGADDGNPTRTETDPQEQGGPVTLLSGGSGKASFYSVVPWQIYANALYQLPMGFDVSGAIFGRKGGIYPVSLRLSGGRDGTNPALATQTVDERTYDNLWNVDLRLAKTFKFNQAALTLSAEWFNVFNSGTVLGRYRYANSSLFTSEIAGAESGKGRIEEVLSPSIFRIGARFTF
jgi:hypothetical protein